MENREDERKAQLIEAGKKDIIKLNSKIELQEELISINNERINVISKYGAEETIFGNIVLKKYLLNPEWAELEKREYTVRYKLNEFTLLNEKFKLINERDMIIERMEELKDD